MKAFFFCSVFSCFFGVVSFCFLDFERRDLCVSEVQLPFLELPTWFLCQVQLSYFALATGPERFESD